MTNNSDDSLRNQEKISKQKESVKSLFGYSKPFISVNKHGENGKLFAEPRYDDGGYNRGRNNH